MGRGVGDGGEGHGVSGGGGGVRLLGFAFDGIGFPGDGREAGVLLFLFGVRLLEARAQGGKRLFARRYNASLLLGLMRTHIII